MSRAPPSGSHHSLLASSHLQKGRSRRWYKLSQQTLYYCFGAGSMKVSITGLWLLSLAALSAAVGCSNSSSGSAIAPIRTGPSVATPTPTPRASSAPATAKPTAKPSSVPATATPTPAPTSSAAKTGNTTCTAPAVAAGIYTSIDSSGVVTGDTYSDDGTGEWEAIEYSSPSPTPTPT